MIDLLVVGGGPAGLATAIHGAKAGLEVVVVERRSGPIDKACGEGLMPHTLRHLERLGVHPHGKPFRGISYRDGNRHVDAPFRHGAGRGVRRTVLHSALLDAAASAGVRICHDEVGEISQDATSVRAGALAGTLPRRRRRAAFADPPVAGPGATEPGCSSVGHPTARADGAVVGLRRGALGARRRGVRDADSRRLRGRSGAEVSSRRIRFPPRGVSRFARSDRGSAARAGSRGRAAAPTGFKPSGRSGSAGR